MTTAPTAASRCDMQVSTSASSFTSSGGAGTVTVATARDCTWTVGTEASWISIGGDRSGQGEATIPYNVAANPVPSPRSGDIVVASQRIQLSQLAAPCRFSLSRAGDTVASAGGRLSVDVSTLTGCGWTASSSQSWITVSSGGSGNANGTVGLTVSANTGVQRSGTVTIGGQTYTVTQDAAPPPAPPPPPPPAPTPTPTPPAPTPTPTPTPAPTPAPPSPTPTPTPTPSPPPSGQTTHLDGTVLLLTGKCPNLTFTILLTVVHSDVSTKFDKKCDDVKNGADVSVDGVVQADRSVRATRIEIHKDDDDEH